MARLLTKRALLRQAEMAGLKASTSDFEISSNLVRSGPSILQASGIPLRKAKAPALRELGFHSNLYT